MELSKKIQSLIKELRNHRNPEKNWKKFIDLVEANVDTITEQLNIRWLISISDTIVDYAEEPRRSKAMVLVSFVTMIKFSETIKFVRPEVSKDRWEKILNSNHTLYEGIDLFSINKQDVLLNLAKRMDDTLKDDELLYSFWKVINKRLLENDTVITDFSKKSTNPQRYFPLNPRQYPDNYGIK